MLAALRSWNITRRYLICLRPFHWYGVSSAKWSNASSAPRSTAKKKSPRVCIDAVLFLLRDRYCTAFISRQIVVAKSTDRFRFPAPYAKIDSETQNEESGGE